MAEDAKWLFLQGMLAGSALLGYITVDKAFPALVQLLTPTDLNSTTFFVQVG